MERWMIVTVETTLEWPAAETAVQFEGHAFILRPPQGDSAADVRLRYEHPHAEQEGFEAICRFLSARAWWERGTARGRLRISCTAPMRGGNGGYGPPLRNGFELPANVTLPADPKARVAIALYREAVSVRNTSYEFLAYFKVINTRYSKGKEQIAWINKTIPMLTDRAARKRISELALLSSDVGEYLYGSGRCAIAHAFDSPVVDPDKPEDIFRLSADMPVVKALAEYLIEHEYGLQ